MTPNTEQIIKALECCRYGGRCAECPCFEMPNCQAMVNENAIALINSQEQRIKELDVALKAMRGAANSYKMHIKELTEENERLRADKKALVNDNAELKNKIQEKIPEEDIDLFDEFTKLLTRELQKPKLTMKASLIHDLRCLGF